MECMKTPLLFGFLCTVGFSGCVHTHEANRSRIEEALPTILKSLPVQIVPSFEHPVLAWTTVSMMQSYVSYNPRIAEKLPPEVLAFALVHEYAHLRLKHVGAFFDAKSPAEVRSQELEADCFAARFWATNDTKVAQAAAGAFLSPTGQRALGSENLSIQTGYPTRKERAQAILDCLTETLQRSSPKNL